MTKFGESQPAGRVEDRRFLTGAGRYLEDSAPADALRAVFLRAPVAHGEIRAIDAEAARDAPGVRLLLTAQDLAEAGITEEIQPSLVTNRDGSKGAAPGRPLLARGRVRFVGEAVAMVVADTLEQARDAAELIELDIEDLDPHLGLAPGGPQLHPEAPDNIAFDFAIGDAEATEAAFARAAHHVTLEVPDNRVIANPMEPRGAWAEWDGARLHLCLSAQGVWGHKAQAARILGLDPEAVQVTIPDVGGGFGTKAMSYPEYFVVAQAARMLGRPVRWHAERGETMLSDNSGRDLVSTAELAFDADHRIIGYRVRNISNLGAYNSQFGQNMQSMLFSRVFTGVYDIPAAHLEAQGIFTNTNPVDAYRGAGRPEAIYVLERAMDHAAQVLGTDPWALRRRNFIAPDAFPYATAAGESYDVGDFARVLDRAAAESDTDGFAQRRADSRARGMLRGRGLCYYIEAIMGDPSERARIVFEDDGTVSLFVGTQSNGQGHETVYARFLEEQLGIPFEAIRVIQGDSDRIAKGGGTGGSRSVTVQSNANIATIDKLIAAFTPFLAEELEVDPETLVFEDGTFRAPGTNRAPSVMEAAELARKRGRGDLLSHAAEAKLAGRSFPNGAHIAEVEIDPDTGAVTLDRYTATDDFGNLLDATLVAGQVHGGVAQGVGQALTEQSVHDETGQLLTASFMDYAMPRADTLPMIRFASEPVPSVMNPLGMKGCGEAGTVGALAAVTNAVRDALREAGATGGEMPFTPVRVWQQLEDARAEHA